MRELPDFDLQRATPETLTNQPSPEAEVRWKGAALLFALFLTVMSAAAYVVFSHRRPLSPAAATDPKPRAIAATAPPPMALGGQPESISIPAVDESDAVVRGLALTLSTHPSVMAWLSSKGLIRTFTAVVANIAEGVSPAKHVAVLRPLSAFRMMEQHENRYIDPHSYDRYVSITDALASIDPSAAARLYATLRPRIREAYRDLGLPDPSFDHTLERAIVALLKTPTIDGPVRLVPLLPNGIGYAFADERLEGMSAAQKHLLRMGPRNGRIIKERLRAIARALGIPDTDLPSA